jgi:hypothetical protein
MSFSIGLCSTLARKGEIPFSIPPATQTPDHDCKSEVDEVTHFSGPEVQALPERRHVAVEDIQGDQDEINAMISEGGPPR